MNRRSLLRRVLTTAPLASLIPLVPARARPRASRRIPLQESPVAGFQYHEGEHAWALLREGDSLALRREPANPHDPRAVAVWWRERKLGYVPRAENVAVARLLDAGERLDARIVRLREARSPWQRVRFAVELRA